MWSFVPLYGDQFSHVEEMCFFWRIRRCSWPTKLETGWSRPQKLAKTIPQKPMENNSTKRLWPWPFVTEVLLLLWCFYSKNTWLVVLHLDFTMPWKKLSYFAVVWQQMLKSILDLIVIRLLFRFCTASITSNPWGVTCRYCVACGELLTLDHPKPLGVHSFWSFFPSASSSRKSVQGM